jgi:membrane-associated phospholipid phosphatase
VVCVVSVTCLAITSPAFGQAPESASSESHSVKGLLKGTVNDFRRLPSEETLTWLTLGGMAAAAGQAGDWNVTNGFSASRMGGMFEAGETLGGARVQLVGALATYAAGRVSGHQRVASVGGELIRAQVLAQVMTAGIKLSVRRHRPDGGEFSFPSGHTSVTFATATVLQRNFGWKAGVPGYALATYVAASRVHVKRHFLSDVAFGAVVGMVAGRTVTIGRGRARFAVSPSVSPNQAGVSFALQSH